MCLQSDKLWYNDNKIIHKDYLTLFYFPRN